MIHVYRIKSHVFILIPFLLIRKAEFPLMSMTGDLQVFTWVENE